MSVKSAGSVTSVTSLTSDSVASVTSGSHGGNPKEKYRYRKRALFQITKVRQAPSPSLKPAPLGFLSAVLVQ